MKTKAALLLVVLGLVWSIATPAAPRFPWTFGMTPEQVKAVTDYGPYRSFSNGDLETYNGLLDGHKQDFQFFFSNGKLVRIGIDLYEGPDLTAAAAEWLNLHNWMKSQFGAIQTPGSAPPSSTGTVFQGVTQAVVDAGGEPQMAPMKQPPDVFVFASLLHRQLDGRPFYVIFLYFNPPRT